MRGSSCVSRSHPRPKEADSPSQRVLSSCLAELLRAHVPLSLGHVWARACGWRTWSPFVRYLYTHRPSPGDFPAETLRQRTSVCELG